MQPSGVVHTALATASLVLGAGIFTLPKGTDLHRAVGAAYVLCMFGLNVTALTIYRVFGGFGVFHALSLMNLAVRLAGFSAVLLRRPRGSWLVLHYYLMGWSYVGLWAAAGSELAVRVLDAPFWLGVMLPTVTITLAGGAWIQWSNRKTLAGVARGRGSARDPKART